MCIGARWMCICSQGRTFEEHACFRASSAGSPVLHHLGCTGGSRSRWAALKAARETQAFPGALSMQDETSNSKFVKAKLKSTSYSVVRSWNKSREDLTRLCTNRTFAFGWVTSTGVLDLAENSKWHFLGLWQSLYLCFVIFPLKC